MKHLSILLAMCVAVFATSCDLDTEDSFETNIAFSQHYTVVDSEGQSNLFPEITVNYELDLTEGDVDILLYKVQFSPYMPQINMEINDLRLTGTNTGYKFSGKNIVPEVNDKEVPEYTITSISGEIYTLYNANGWGCKLTFVVNNKYTVNAYSSPMLFEQNSFTSVTKSPLDSDLFTYDKALYVIDFDAEKTTAEIDIYNITFATGMPAMNITLKDIPVKATPNGIEISYENELIPSLNNKEQTPVSDFPITNLYGTIIGDKLQLDFDCTYKAMIQTYHVSSTVYLLPQTSN